MASFVSEVLTSAGQLESQEVIAKLQVLTKKVDDLKLQMYEVITKKYGEVFPGSLKRTIELADGVRSMSEQADEISEKIENEVKNQLNLSTAEFQSLTSQLQEVSGVLTILDKLVKLQDGLELIASSSASKQFSVAADSLLNVETLLNQPVHRLENEIKILTALQTDFRVQKEKILYDLGDHWKEHILWTVPEKADSEVAKNKCELKLITGGDNISVLSETVAALEKLNALEMKIKLFGERLVTHFLKPIITWQDCCLENKSHGQVGILSVSLPQSDSGRISPPPTLLFPKILGILNFLNNNILHVKVDIQNPSSASLMDRLGVLIGEQVLDLTVKDCLAHAIPTNNKELANFQEVIDATEAFQNQLLELKFITESNTSLMDYVRNINILFANKKCQEILEKARTLMTSDVHNTVQVSGDKPLGDLPPLAHNGPSSKKVRKMELAAECSLSSNTFRLPSCHISACIQQVMDLAYETLHEATESSPQCAIQLFYAVRNMFELFCHVFPIYHKQNLAMLPQLTALHHNNCMFIAHHLMTLGHQFSRSLPASINATFVDQVPIIRRLGAESFLEQMTKQKNQMAEYLKGANGFNNVSEEDIYLGAERAIKQTLHQLQHLQKVWQEVLPSHTYRKSIGTLLNTVLTEITSCVVELEDISSEDARNLSILLTLILEKAGALFITPSEQNTNTEVELQRNVPKWTRFKELNFILSASLQEISDRWVNGKGPLAVEFAPNEIKQLIRALFQNTDRRAAVLARIK